ncbi:MAG: 2-succinyl-5-enolpyruvyl-6-hydroxy-3-cyclohexene-1-carboxylic-acid synthase [Gemmatimonadota bacterium]|nr:2-succinyl-5-enolpyruvyl-6-hydroxy-3-cyclohexene-1-carboxylic-acid synthase [Gemmatimonadota bacterium]
MSFGHLQAAWADWLLDGLVAAGVRRAVVSPGSRSTPLVLAAARAEAAGRLEVTVVPDERSAGFVALGQARVTGVPSLLVCTSGTAGAHWLPAVIEASETGIPLLALTADRPFELQARGANQTIEQAGLFGRHVRAFVELGGADPDPRACIALPRTAARAVQVSLVPDPGPVHLNARFRKPLQVLPPEPPDVTALRARVTAAAERGVPRPRRVRLLPDAADLDALATRLRRARRGVLVAGPLTPADALREEAVRRFLAASGFVLLAEATSQLRFGLPRPHAACDAFEPLLAAPPERRVLQPDFVLQVGLVPSGRGLAAWLMGEEAPERVVLAARGWPEGFNRAADVWVTDPSAALEGLADRMEGAAPEADWAGRAAAAAGRTWEILDGLLAGRPGFLEAAAVRAAVEAVPEGGLLALGNSLPVREVDLFCPASGRRFGVLSQRGASGIDGLVSGAAGAVAASGRPGVLLLGDVSFLHDVGGLAAARDLPAPLAVVVLRNGGGRLFELLPVREHPGTETLFHRLFLTDPRLEAAVAGQAFGVPSVVADTPGALREALSAALERPGATLVEARVDGEATAALVADLNRAVAAEVRTG